jgi:hypothetical protein
MTSAALNEGLLPRRPVTMRDAPALERLLTALAKQHDKKFCADEFNRFEVELAERLREVGREALARELKKADVDADSVLIDGVTHRRVLRGTETYMTTLGPIEVERTLYKDRTDPGARAVAALEKRLGVISGFWLPQAAKQAAWVVSQMTPRLSEELFERVGNMQPSKSSLDRLPKQINEDWEADRNRFETELRTVTEIPEETQAIAISLDGVLAPMKDGDAVETRKRAADEGRLTKGPAGYREVGCATITFCDEEGDMISAIRMARMPEPNKLSLKGMMIDELGRLLSERPDLPVVKIADGAEDNWTFLSQAIPLGAEVLDFFHAAEHLGDALAAAYGEGSRDARMRFEELREVLRDDCDGVEQVIRKLVYLRSKHPRRKRIENALGYFRKHRRRMRYFELKEAGLPIGSGPVEAACKTLVAQRMKQSGMRWGEHGGQGILTIRGWCQSERFDHAWAVFAATHRVEVTVLDNVIAFPSRNRSANSASV